MTGKSLGVRIGVAALGVLLLVGLVLVTRNRLQEANAKGATQDERVEIPVPVRIATAQQAPLEEWVYATGNARAARREYLVFRTSGRVATITSRSGRTLREGDRVHGPRPDAPRGELLAQLDATEQLAALEVAHANLREAQAQVIGAKAAIEQAKGRLELAERKLVRETELMKTQATSREELEEAESNAQELRLAADVESSSLLRAQATVRAAEAKLTQAEEDLEKTRIYCPIDGAVAYKNLEMGWQYDGSTRTDSESSVLKSVPFVVIDPSELEVILPIAAYEASRVARGQPVSIRRARDEEDLALGDAARASSIQGQVYTAPPAIDPGARSVQVRVRTTEGTELLRDGEHVTCRITVSSKTALSIPSAALVARDRDVFVYVVDGDHVQRRQITVGAMTEAAVEVLSGLEAGERVVTAGRFDLYEGAKVEVIDGAAE